MVGRVLGIAALATLFAAAPSPAGELGDFGRCLARAGSKFYTAAWCPQCARQEELLGDALTHLEQIDCTDPVDCADEDVRALPTWEFGDGSRSSGVLTLTQLEHRTGCRVDERPAGTATAGAPASGLVRTREHRVPGGPLIIDVR